MQIFWRLIMRKKEVNRAKNEMVKFPRQFSAQYKTRFEITMEDDVSWSRGSSSIICPSSKDWLPVSNLDILVRDEISLLLMSFPKIPFWRPAEFFLMFTINTMYLKYVIFLKISSLILSYHVQNFHIKLVIERLVQVNIIFAKMSRFLATIILTR